MAWNLFPGVEHVCDVCRKTLRVKDVGEHRTTYSYATGVGVGSTVFWCRNHYGGRARVGS